MTWLLLVVLIYKISLELFPPGTLAVTVETGLAAGAPIHVGQGPRVLSCALRIGTCLENKLFRPRR